MVRSRPVIYRNTCPRKLPLWLIAFAVLVAFQPRLAEAQDINQDVEQTRQTAERGDAQAQYNLGMRYAKGKGPQDHQEALKWVRKAAEQKYASAQLNLGYMYDKGLGVPESDSEAVKWYRLAAEQGDAIAQSNLGNMYHFGEGVLQDFVKAHAWLNLAAAQGNKKAAKSRDRLSEKMTAEQVGKAQRLAAELFTRIEVLKSE